MLPTVPGRAPTQEATWLALRVRPPHPLPPKGLVPAVLATLAGARLAPSATLKISHARILKEYRGPSDANRFHDLMKGAT